MTEDDFRSLALALPETEESAHMGHPDFRVGGKIFSSLGAGCGTVKLTPDQQEEFMAAAPDAFSPAAGAWGRRGYTTVTLRTAKKNLVRDAILAAWRNTAPKRLLE